MHRDTSSEAAAVQTAILRRLGAARRLEIAFEMSETVRELACARIRSAHAEFDETTVRDQLIWELHKVRREDR